MQHLSSIDTLRALQPFFAARSNTGPGRKRLEAPFDKGLFVKPLKQSFLKNPRLMPGTRIVIALLAGWAGHDRPIETTLGIIGRHIGRSARQVQRYLKDAAEEGYLRIAYTKDRIGRITGLRIHLTRVVILHKAKTRPQAAETLATTYPSDTKGKDSFTNTVTSRKTARTWQRPSTDLTAAGLSARERLASKGSELLAAAHYSRSEAPLRV